MYRTSCSYLALYLRLTSALGAFGLPFSLVIKAPHVFVAEDWEMQSIIRKKKKESIILPPSCRVLHAGVHVCTHACMHGCMGVFLATAAPVLLFFPTQPPIGDSPTGCLNRSSEEPFERVCSILSGDALDRNHPIVYETHVVFLLRVFVVNCTTGASPTAGGMLCQAVGWA